MNLFTDFGFFHVGLMLLLIAILLHLMGWSPFAMMQRHRRQSSKLNAAFKQQRETILTAIDDAYAEAEAADEKLDWRRFLQLYQNFLRSEADHFEIIKTKGLRHCLDAYILDIRRLPGLDANIREQAKA